MPSFTHPIFAAAQENANEITEQESTLASQQATIATQESTLASQQATIGAQETNIESALGNGDNPANAANELYGCYPLFRGREHAKRYKEAHASIEIPVGGTMWNRPVGPAFFKGHHDSVKVPEEVSFAPADVASAIADDPSAYPQLAFDDMFLADGTQTQTKKLVEIAEVMPEKWAVYEGSCDKGEWVEPGVLGYRVHVTSDNIYYTKYSHPTLRTTEYLVESTSFTAADGNVFKHKDYTNVLVAISETGGLRGTRTPRFMNAFNSLKSLEGRNRIEAKLVAAGKTSTESLAAYNEFVARLEQLCSDAAVESGAHDTNSELFKKGICYTDQVVYTFVFDEENNEVQVLEQYNYSDGIFDGNNDFTDDELSDNVVSVLDVLLEDSPLRFEYEGVRGKYQNKLRMKRFPRDSKFSLKKVARASIAVAYIKSIAQVDADRLAYSISAASELKAVLKHRMFKAAELYFAAHATVATGDEKTYYDKRAEDYYNLALAMATHALTFEGATVTDPTPVPWNAGDGGLLDVLVEDGKVLSGYHYFSPRTVTIADSAAERTFVPTYELNYATSQLDTRTTTVEDTLLIDQIFSKTSSHGNGTIVIGIGDLTFDPADPNVVTRDENGLIPIDPDTGGFAMSAIGNEYGEMEVQFTNAYLGNLSGVGGYTFMGLDNASEIVYTNGSVNYNGSIGELNYSSVTAMPVNATVARHHTPMGQAALTFWNGTWAEQNGYGDKPSRLVIMFSAFPLWNGVQSLPVSKISTNFAPFAGQFVTMIFTIRNTEGFISWVKNELVPFCESRNLYILVNSPTSHGVDVGGDKHNLKWGEDKTKGYGTHTVYLGGTPIGIGSTRVDTASLTDIRTSLGLVAEEVFTQITEQGARNAFFGPPVDPSNLLDGSYTDSN